jgi:23S rRNA pseudouridine955/2504/2580 synthase
LVLITIDNPSDADQRIDKFLRKYLPNAPLGGIFKWLRTGKVKVNEKKVDQNYRILLDDTIALYFTEWEIAAFQYQKESASSQGKSTEREAIEILYEDEYLLIANKPSGMNVHPSDHKSSEVSLIERIQDTLGGNYNTLSFKPSLVHRIDRDTSGCIIIAKEKKALEKLLFELQNWRIEKKYHTIVIWTPKEKNGVIDQKLLRIENAKDEAKVRIDANWLTAVTHYRTIKENIKNKYSLLECEIETGRTHQIRVHMSYLGTPILGDKAYGNSKENSFARREYHIERQLLHAYSLSFLHPISHKTLTIIAPYWRDMDEFIKNWE